MSDLAQPGESEGVAVNDLLGMSETELSVREVLRAADGFVHYDTIVQVVMDDAAFRTQEVLEDLKSRGVVRCSAGRWRLRKQPTTTLSLKGDPNFRRGDR